jgi:hypothetical protein
MLGRNPIALVAVSAIAVSVLSVPAMAQRQYSRRTPQEQDPSSQYQYYGSSTPSTGVGQTPGRSGYPGAYRTGGYYKPDSSKPGTGRFGSGGLPSGYPGGPVTPPSGTPMRSSGFKMETMPGAIYPGQNQSGAIRGFPASGLVSDMAAEVERLSKKIVDAKIRGDLPGTAQANAAQQQLLHQLNSQDPQNPRWKMLRAQTFIEQAGGKSRSGTAGDQASLKMAIRDLDAAMACPGCDQYSSLAKLLKAKCQGAVQTRAAKSAEIRRRGARQFAEIYAKPDVQNSTCNQCGHYKSSVDRCATCGAF